MIKGVFPLAYQNQAYCRKISKGIASLENDSDIKTKETLIYSHTMYHDLLCAYFH